MINGSPHTEPQHDQQRPHEPALIRRSPGAAAASSPPIARILVSDDDPAIRRIYAAILPAHGFEIVEAPGGDGWATLELARRTRPWLLLTDVNKPGLDGRRLRAALRADRRTARMPLLTVSAIDLHPPFIGPRDDTLLKPFDFGTLLYRLTTLLPLTASAHTRLAAYALEHPILEATHPVTGLPGLHAVAAQLPVVTAQPEWAALSLSLADMRRQVRLRGRAAAEALFTRLADAVRPASSNLLVGHTGLDAQIVLVGPATAVAHAAAATQASLPGLYAFAHRLATADPLPFIRARYADARHGYGLTLLQLRRALA
jgi:DNA-binding response OmpR family regulator